MQGLKRLTFYVEPVVYRQDPLFLSPWIEWIARIIRAQARIPDLSFGIVSSPWLCRALQDMVGPIRAFPIDPVDVLRPFGMDRVLYGRDLARPVWDDVGNEPLRASIAVMASTFQPDAILSFTQNRYLAALSPAICTLFTEMQPLPRSFGTGFFLDRSGHQSESMLVTEAARIRSLQLSQDEKLEAGRRWESGFVMPNRDHPETAEMLAWLERSAEGAPVAMLALQPPDWLTVEGLSSRTSPEDTLLAWLDALPKGWRAVATYHPAHALPRAVEECIAGQMPNFMLLPDSWRQGRSEWLLQAVEAVVTVSSAVGWSALLAGKRTVAMGQSNLTGFAASSIGEIDEIAPLSIEERYNLFAFLKNRYCIDEESFLDKEGFFRDRVSSIMNMGEEYYFW